MAGDDDNASIPAMPFGGSTETPWAAGAYAHVWKSRPYKEGTHGIVLAAVDACHQASHQGIVGLFYVVGVARSSRWTNECYTYDGDLSSWRTCLSQLSLARLGLPMGAQVARSLAGT